MWNMSNMKKDKDLQTGGPFKISLSAEAEVRRGRKPKLRLSQISQLLARPRLHSLLSKDSEHGRVQAASNCSFFSPFFVVGGDRCRSPASL